MLQLFISTDAFRRKERFQKFLMTCTAIAQSQNLPFDSTYFLKAYTATQSIETQALLDQGLEGRAFAEELNRQRLAVIKKSI